jgi:hypothetical protein
MHETVPQKNDQSPPKLDFCGSKGSGGSVKGSRGAKRLQKE